MDEIKHLENALVFLSRATLSGKEVEAYIDSRNAIIRAISEMKSSQNLSNPPLL